MQIKNLSKLISQSKKSNRVAQAALFDFYAEYLMGIALRYVKDRELAKDVFLMAFERVFRKIDMYDPSKGEFKSWITRITINEALTHYRKESKYNDILIIDDLTISIENDALSDLNVNQICELSLIHI